MPNPTSSRAKHAAGLTGQPSQPRGSGGRSQHAATLTGTPPRQPLHPRAGGGLVGRHPSQDLTINPLPAPLQFDSNRPVTITHVRGIEQAIGKTITANDGRKYKIVGAVVTIPETSITHAFTKTYGNPYPQFTIQQSLSYPRFPTPATVPWVDPVGDYLGGWGELASGAEHIAGKVTLGNNWRIYYSGWAGNQYVKTISAVTFAKTIGTVTFVLGTLIDAYGVKTYYEKGADDPNAVHPAQAGANLGVGVWALILGGPYTATAATFYYLGTLAPGGWPALLEHNALLQKKNQKVLGKRFNLYKDYSGF